MLQRLATGETGRVVAGEGGGRGGGGGRKLIE